MSSLAATQKREAALLLPLYDRYALKIVRGNGVYVWDEKGRRYLDFLSGIGVNALGYNHPAVRRTIAQMTGRGLIHLSNLFYTDYQAALAERLTKLSGLDRAFFCNSGTEAWEAALKFARAYAQTKADGREPKWRILAMQDAFHGRTFGSVACTWSEKYRKPFVPLLPGVDFVKFNDVADLAAKLNDDVCAVGLEAVQGEGGIRPVSPEFIRAARELTKKRGALLICDEIQAGLGRTGKMFAYQHFGVHPDMVTVAKPLAGGLPLGAVLATNEVSSALHPGMHGTTFGGGPLACAVALTVLDVIKKDKLIERNVKLGAYFRAELQKLAKKHKSVADVRVLGLMAALELDNADLAKSVARQMLDAGIIINRTHETALRMLPPFLIGKQHIDTVVRALDSILTKEARGKHSQPALQRSTR